MSYLTNLAKLTAGKRLLDPLVAIYYITTHCNLNCAYCEDFGARRNPQNDPPLPLDEALKVLRIIRSGIPRLWLTGGEPLLVPQIDELVARAKTDLKFREITLITNGTLLPDHPQLLSRIDRLVISLDSLDPAAWSALNMPQSYLDSILGIIENTATLQGKHKFRLILNAVITPEGLGTQDALRNTYHDLISFCQKHQINISFSPQSANNWPRYELLTSPAYKAFIQHLIGLKKRGAPILGSFAYLKNLLTTEPYDCYPTLAPRIMPNGDLTYPCRPIEKAGGEHGGRPVNLRDVPNWKTAWQRAHAAYGDPPTMCVSCFQQCYAEASLMQSRPVEYALEKLLYAKNTDLTTYVPG